MKKFMRFVMEMKSWISLSFTAAMLIYLTVEFLLACVEYGGNLPGAWGDFTATKMRCGLILEIFVLCACITVLQYVFFSGRVLKKPSYGLRMLCFAVLCFGICLGFGLAFRWFPAENPGAWVSFAVIFLIAFAGISLGFEVYYRVMGRRYNQALGRKQKGAGGGE